MAIEVRPASLHDLPAVRRLLTHLQEPATEVAWSATLWTRMLSDPNRAVLLAFDREEYPVGTADLSIVPNRTYEGSPWAIVENIVVDPAWRGHGVDRTLLRHAIRLAEDAGCRVTTRSRRARSAPSARRRPSADRA